MELDERRIAYAMENTEVLRPPRQTLATFGTTNIYYYLVTRPAYAEVAPAEGETVVREGRVISERPRVVTPSYLTNIEGFSEHARRYLEMAIRQFGPHAPGLFYKYRNEPKELSIVSDTLEAVVQNLNSRLDKAGEQLAAIIKGVDELWDVSLMKFIYDLTASSLGSNISELGMRGLLDVDRAGVPQDARLRIEELFDEIRRGEAEPYQLKLELDRWGLFHEYEDRFLSMFRRR